ncbi:MAG: hypothetical protein M4579_001990 [Chaenotheca gracillima]|nr:MAG: hypothetical protein M4579_001990 [Chaenotheca gracillima]
MPYGILNAKSAEAIPGTAFVSDFHEIPPEFRHIPREQLKHGTGRFSDIVLVPQPSNSLNDPLNWPQWQKEMILIIIGLSAAVVGAFGPMLSPGFVEVSADLGISINTLSQSTAWLILTIGISLFFANPASKVWGKRPVYIVAIVIMFVGSIWGGAAQNYSSFLASRVVSGFGMAPYEVLVQCTIGDLYFVHERATRIAVWNMFLLCGIAGGGLVSGYIIEDLGYRWTFWVCAIFFGVFVLCVIFLVPETSYNRVDRFRRWAQADEKHVANNLEVGESKTGGTEQLEQTVTFEDGAAEPRMSYLSSLRVFTGTYSHAPFWKIFLRPLVVFWYPGVLWAFLVYGTTLTWIVVFSVVNAAIFTLPPYNFSVSQTGLISLSPFILTLVGELISGPLNDWLCLHLARKNRGVYESEFRLILIIVSALLGTAGFFGFGATVHYQTHWSGPVITFGLANMAMAFASSCVFGYVIDSYPKLAEEAFVAINARNFLTFGLTYFVNDWLAQSGPLLVFSVLGALFLFVLALTIPLYVFGKRARAWIARNQWLQRFMNDD